jgi:hypothetical protein
MRHLLLPCLCLLLSDLRTWAVQDSLKCYHYTYKKFLAFVCFCELSTWAAHNFLKTPSIVLTRSLLCVHRAQRETRASSSPSPPPSSAKAISQTRPFLRPGHFSDQAPRDHEVPSAALEKTDPGNVVPGHTLGNDTGNATAILPAYFSGLQKIPGRQLSWHDTSTSQVY